jgi:hypothetical protein
MITGNVFHPLQLIPERLRPRIAGATAGLALLLAAGLAWAGAPLHIAAAPQGIVSLELAGTPERAAAIVQAWKDDHPPAPVIDRIEGIVQPVPHGKDDLAVQTTFADFVFILFYAAALAMACVWLAETTRLPAAGVLLGWLMAPAALCDAAENTLLLRALNGEPAAAGLTLALALAKFAIVLAALGYSAWCLRRLHRRALAAAAVLVWTVIFYSVAAELIH